jgi:dolichol-phosphate mannosyltransferase
MKDLSIVIPAYNEEKRIGRTLKSLSEKFNDSEIIVVSNGSKDKTVEVVEEFCKKNKNFSCLVFPEKLGKGGATIEGFKKASRNLVGFLDADDSFYLEDIKKMISELKNYDGVIASKWLGQNMFTVDEPFIRKSASRVWNLLVRLILGLKYRDTQGGAKFFRREKLDLREFICKDYSFDVEILYRLRSSKIFEMYVPSKFQIGSKFGYKSAFSMFRNLLKLKFK